MKHLTTVAALVVTAAMVGCGDPQADRPDGSRLFGDGGASEPPPAPRLDDVPTPVPWPVATLRGSSSNAERVIVGGGANPISSTVLPDGTFCVDVPLPTPDTYDLSVRAYGDNGEPSESAAMATVVFDPAAAPIPGLTKCDGSDPAGCIGSVEICDNSIDDDCNGLRDDRDPACSDCTDDVLEPNDEPGAPRIEPGRTDGLQICPGNSDYYGVFLRPGDLLTARLFFSHASGDLDMELTNPAGTELERAVSTTDDETITWTALVEGEHELHVYGVGDAQNTYALDVSVVPGD